MSRLRRASARKAPVRNLSRLEKVSLVLAGIAMKTDHAMNDSKPHTTLVRLVDVLILPTLRLWRDTGLIGRHDVPINLAPTLVERNKSTKGT